MTKKMLRFAAVALLLLGTALLLAACSKKHPCEGGHTLVVTSIEPATCTENAMEHRTCQVCGQGYSNPILDTALGHDFVDGFCTVCGYADTPQVVRQGALLFVLNSKGNAYSVQIDGGELTGEVRIPETVYNLPVALVAANGFKNQADMTSILFPDTITEIGKSAFEGCTGLTTLTVGSGVKRIGDRAFFGCTNLTEVTVQKKTEYIGSAAFGGCGKLRRLVIPFVGSDNAIMRLYGCYYNLGHIFGKEKYSGAQKVTMAYRKVTNSGTKLDQATYYIPSSLEYVEVTVGNYYAMGSNTNRYLEDGAFHNCTMIKELVLAPTITIAESYSLEGLTNLQRLIAPGVQSGILSMQYTPALREIDCAYPTLRYDIPKVTLRGITAQTDLSHLADCNQIEELTLVFAEDHEKVTQAQLEPVLSKITGLGVTSPDTEIEAGVFSSIATLKKAILPIEALASLNMTHLEELTVLADRPYIISNTLFGSATALRSLTLDSRVTGFVEGAFENCNSLASVTLDGTAEGLAHEVLTLRWLTLSFGGHRANPLCHGAGLYLKTSSGSEPIGALTLPEDMTSIGAFVFDGCTNLTALTFGAQVRTVGQNAFRGTAALLSVTFEGTLAEWLALEFANGEANPVNGAQSLYFGEEELTALDAAATLTEISPYAFYGYLGLTSLSFGEGLVKIGTSAFFGCAGLVDVALPATLTRVEAFAFSGCMALESATFADAGGWYLFESATSLQGIPITATQLTAEGAAYLVTLYPDYIFKKVG